MSRHHPLMLIGTCALVATTAFVSGLARGVRGASADTPAPMPIDDSEQILGMDPMVVEALYPQVTTSTSGNAACGEPSCLPESWTDNQRKTYFIEHYLDRRVWDHFKNNVRIGRCCLATVDGIFAPFNFDNCPTEGYSQSIDRCEQGGGWGDDTAICLNGWQIEGFVHEAAHNWHFTYWRSPDRGACQWDGNWDRGWSQFNEDLMAFLFDGECPYSYASNYRTTLQNCANARTCALNEANRLAYPEFFEYLLATWREEACATCRTGNRTVMCPDMGHLFADIASWSVSCAVGGSPANMPPEILAWYDGFLPGADGYGPPQCD